MRLVLLCCVLPTVAFAQLTEAQQREARRISELMKQDAARPAPVKLTPPEQLLKRGTVRLFVHSLPVNKPADYAAYLRFVTDEKLLQQAVDTVNELAALPRDVVVTFRDCGEPQAFYEPKSGGITFCYELVKLFDQLYTKQAKSPGEAKELIRGAVFFVFFHEFGHALVHELGLPITGREEDAVDQFATLLLLEQGEQGEAAALSGAAFFLALAQLPGKKPIFWDQHSLDAQRFYNIGCWLYGASPFRQVNLVAQGLLPAPRAAGCGDEFTQLRSSWKTIAEPKLKRPFKPLSPR
ncbi:MAG: hypothetical protein IAE78_26320 [Myxococcus sp.]|nr:hypothetical protein [Myxococcus sp.]